MQGLAVSNLSLLLALFLVVVAMGISVREKLDLHRDIIYAILRAIIQLTVVGYVLKAVFHVANIFLTLTLTLIIILNASWNAYQRNGRQKRGFIYSFIAIFSSTTVTIMILVLSGSIRPVAQQLVPISGMIASNSMVAIGLAYRAMRTQFKQQAQQVNEMLALGATGFQASRAIIRESIKTGMQPTIDSAKTVGLVSLPGMMSGLIFAGVDPVYAIKYQIMVTFMLMSATSIGSVIAIYLSYRNYFNDRLQLVLPEG